MKKILFSLLTVFLTVLSTKAQVGVPQSVCYQAVATDQRGVEIVSQKIGIRISILKGSTTGAAEWIETHTPTTDGFGLFDLPVGQGTPVAGGSQTAFQNIKWGADKYFLKIELDITGGTNYVLMGTNLIMSVPYALYSEKSATAAFADSARVSQRAKNADRADVATLADRATLADSAKTSATAAFATTANTANTAVNAQTADLARRATNADNAVNAQTALRAAFADSTAVANRANSATNATTATYADSSRSATKAATATTATTANRAIFADSTTAAARAFFAQNAQNATSAQTAQQAQTALDDRDRDNTNEIQTFSYSNGVFTLSNPQGAASQVVLSAHPFLAPGATFDFPQGIQGDYQVISTNYTVPAGRTLYITAANGNIDLSDGRSLSSKPAMPVIPENTTISSCFCTGVVISNTNTVTPQIIDFTDPSFIYSVPNNRTLVIKSGTARSRLDLQIDGVNYIFYSGDQGTLNITIPGGHQVKKSTTTVSGDKLLITGYLINN